MSASAQETVKLPEPQKKAEMSVMQALQQRHSVRDFQNKAVSEQTLSDLLWAACGVNRAEKARDGKSLITAPSAGNRQDCKVYVLKADGAWLYIPEAHSLQKITDKNLITMAGKQEFVKTVPVNLLLVSDQRNESRLNTNLANIDCGYVSENIYLACTALGLGTVAIGSLDKEPLIKELNLTDMQLILISHPIGYEKAK